MQEGRVAEAERLIEERWRALEQRDEERSDQAVNLVRLHMELRWKLATVESLRAELDRVGRLAPNDDRIWLGRANLAIREGSYDQAARWLDDCIRLHPDDPAVQQARMEWAMRTGRLAEAREALKHLPAGAVSPAEVHRVAAWMASMCGDVERRRQELTALVAEMPIDFEALDQLEAMERQHPPGTAPAAPRGSRAEIERDLVRYRALHRRHQPARDAQEMARLAERLGQRFEAIVWLDAAIAEEPGRDDLRADRRRLAKVARDAMPEEGRSLFDRLRIDYDGERPAPVSEPG
jgi:tetratricopeptide (TPR) repeat protein